jgi:hypothetical protein
MVSECNRGHGALSRAALATTMGPVVQHRVLPNPFPILLPPLHASCSTARTTGGLIGRLLCQSNSSSKRIGSELGPLRQKTVQSGQYFGRFLEAPSISIYQTEIGVTAFLDGLDGFCGGLDGVL